MTLTGFVQALENRRCVVGMKSGQQLRSLYVVELLDDVGDVLGMDLFEQVDDLVGILA